MGDANSPADKPLHLGHRDRFRERFASADANALADYELLELYLCLAIPRRDVKPIAKKLLVRFDSLNGVLAAPDERLREIAGIGPQAAQAIKLAQALKLRGLKEQLSARPLIGSWDALLDYCRAHMAHEASEQLRVLFLDIKNGLIADEIQQQGTVNHVTLYPREVIKRALELGAASIILVHNYPSGDPTPSKADIDLTTEIIEAGKRLGVAVHDHLIIGRAGHSSFRALGLL